MSKRFSIILYFICFLGILVILFLAIKMKIQIKTNVEQTLKIMPQFKLSTLSNEIFTNHSLPAKPILFIYFHSSCDYCQIEANNIHHSKEITSKIAIFWISNETTREIGLFSQKYLPDTEQNNYYFLKDDKNKFVQAFKINTTPTALLYSSEKILIKRYKGVVKVKTIIQDLENFSTQ